MPIYLDMCEEYFKRQIKANECIYHKSIYYLSSELLSNPMICFCLRIDGIKPGYPAESCGLKCGDYIIFVEKTNVTMKGQEEVLRLFE